MRLDKTGSIRTRAAAAWSATTALAAITVSCGGPAEDPNGPSRVDSMGVELVSVPTPDTTRDRWVTAAEPEVEIGSASGDVAYLLEEVRGAARLGDGRIVLADRGSDELRYFGADGTILARVGREGEGPGEFTYLNFVAALPGDSVLAYDRSLQRLSLFGPDGVFGRSWNTTVAGAPTLQNAVAVTGSGDLLMEAFVGLEPEVVGPYFLDQAVGVFEREARRYVTVDTVSGSEAAFVERDGRLRPAVVPFGRKADFVAAGDHVFLLDALEESSIRVYSSGGALIRILRMESAGADLDAGMRARWVDSFFEQNENVFADVRVAQAWRYGFERVSTPPTLAPFRSLETDRAGNVCAERYGPTETTPSVFWCFTPEGRFVRSVELAAATSRTGFPHQDPSLEIGDDYVLGVWEDELGVQYVRLYPLRREG